MISMRFILDVVSSEAIQKYKGIRIGDKSTTLALVGGIGHSFNTTFGGTIKNIFRAMNSSNSGDTISSISGGKISSLNVADTKMSNYNNNNSSNNNNKQQ